ncbi:MAG: insulinase family protein, partial [Bacteroidota bacterium]
MDSSVRTGTLSNGMRYYVRKNARPEKRAEFRLAVNAGSTAENDDQQGLAHVVEHMAFNGTKNFKKSEIVDYLESVGTKFGAHLNAYTSFDETVYMLQLPTDKPEIVEKGLQILEDWSYALAFDSMEVEKERGVVVEEWRLGQGANERMRRKYWPTLFKGSRYESRLPIGKKEIIEHCPQSVLRDFYRDWYRPDLMAVIAVGDFNVDEMVAEIISRFSAVPVVSNRRPLKVWPVPDNDAMAIATCTDKEAQNAQIEIIYKQNIEEQSTVGDYRRSMAQQLFSAMLSERLDELQRSSDPPFLYAGGDYGDLVRNKNAFTSFAIAKEDGIERAFENVLIENERVRRFGFTEGELSRQKADMFSRMQKSFNERDMTESRSLATECVSNFLRKEPMPGIAYEFELYKSYLDGISLSEVNAFAEKWITDGKNCVVIITAPEKPTTRMPDSTRIRSMFSNVRSMPLSPYVDKVVMKPLVDPSLLKPGKIVSEKTISEMSVTEWKLSNGARVLFKQTDFKDEVLFSAYSWGGWSNYGKDDFMSASVCDEIVRESGLGEFDATALGKALSGRLVRCSPYVSELQQGLNGNCAPKDIEVLFQLIFKNMTDPRRDTAAFRSFLAKKEASVRNRGNDPQAVFSDTMSYAMSGYDYRFKPRTSSMMNQIDLDRAMKSYRERFSDASGFTFFFVGSISPDTLRKYAEIYLSSLPVSDKKSNYKDIGLSPPK